jgi:hypothetical protein
VDASRWSAHRRPGAQGPHAGRPGQARCCPAGQKAEGGDGPADAAAAEGGAAKRPAVRLKRTCAWLTEHGRLLGISVAIALGIYLTISGIVGLVS